jgi:hypothetical protein
MTSYPDYWKVLATPVPQAQGEADFRNVRIWNLEAKGATTAFEVNAFPDKRLENFSFSHLQIDAATAGHLSDVANWKFSRTIIKTADGSVVALTDDVHVQGIPTRTKTTQPSVGNTSKTAAVQDQKI